eukprot:583569-Hanusia_phi.AAC.1
MLPLRTLAFVVQEKNFNTKPRHRGRCEERGLSSVSGCWLLGVACPVLLPVASQAFLCFVCVRACDSEIDSDDKT